jgi:hypothetical protein
MAVGYFGGETLAGTELLCLSQDTAANNINITPTA